MSRHVARWASLAASFAGGFGLAAASMLAAMDAASLPGVQPRAGLTLGSDMARLRAEAGADAVVIYMGDSLVMDLDPPDRSVPTTLSRMVRREAGDRSLRMLRAAVSGLGIFSQYFLGERVASAQPELVILSFNLRWLSAYWQRENERPDMVGLLPLRRWPEAAALSLHRVGVSADQALLMRALVAGSGAESWLWLRAEQARAAGSYARLEAALARWAGSENALRYRADHYTALRRSFSHEGRSTRELAQLELGPALAGLEAADPALRILAAALRRLREAEIPALVYVAPLNVEHLARIGLYDAQGLSQTIGALKQVAEQEGADFVDLHDLLPDAAFLDFADHLRTEPASDSSALVALELLPTVLGRLSEQAGG